MTKTEIVNIALAHLGVQPVGDVDTDPQFQAGIARQLWESTYARALARHRWTFVTTTSAQLALDVDESPDGWNRYQPPGNVLSIVKLMDENGYKIHFRMEDGLIVVDDDTVSDSDAVYLLYQADPGLNELPVWFVDALAYELAYRMATALTENTTLKESLKDDARNAWREAARINDQGRGNERFADLNQYTMLSMRR